jgi:hypothetical protein
MRTTLDIDDDVLLAAKEVARRERRTAGKVLSELARRGLLQGSDRSLKKAGSNEVFLGFHPFAPRGTVVTNELIDHIREDFD